jgi:metal-responsive CopG/Arc/MetJ family transcriptional regulator
MANKPHKDTVIASFTLPRFLLKVVEEKANRAMTNKSDVIRKALMNYLEEHERQIVLKEIEENYSVKKARKESEKPSSLNDSSGKRPS